MRSQKALRSVVTSLVLQVITIVCGFIVPRLTIATFGSQVNGTVASITQFLSYIVLLEAGAGGVVKAALYKPLNNNDLAAVSSTVKAAEIFFRRVALFFTAYMLVLACVFPLFTDSPMGWLFDFSLVLIIGISTIVQYYFGITSQILIQADQKRYVTANLQTVSLIANTVLTVILIATGQPIHIVKLGSALVFTLRPLFLYLYVRKNYALNKNAVPDNEAILHRWDGFGHHVAYFLHTNTDIAVLTVFSKLSNTATICEVSVYTVYYAVVAGVEKLIATFSSGLEAAFGNMIANKEDAALGKNFNAFEFFSFIVTTAAFTATAIIILPFIGWYTRGITDVDYIRPTFAYILTLAEAVYCIRIPYNSVTLAAGHYRETRNGAFVEAGVNIVLSIVLVCFFGISGVAFATLIAMTLRTAEYVYYLSKYILKRSITVFLMRLALNICASAVSVILTSAIPCPLNPGFFALASYAVAVLVVCSAVTVTINSLFYRNDLKYFLVLLKGTLRPQ